MKENNSMNGYTVLNLGEDVYIKKHLDAKCELVLMGRAVVTKKFDEVKYIIEYVTKVMTNCGQLHSEISADDVISKVKRFMSYDNPELVGICLNRIEGMPVMSFILKDRGEKNFKIDSDNGVLIYAYNFAQPLFSEGGYAFFEKSDRLGGFHRVG